LRPCGICGSRIAASADEAFRIGAGRARRQAQGRAAGNFSIRHVHIGNDAVVRTRGAERDPRAAILGGVTTIGIMVRSSRTTPTFCHLPRSAGPWTRRSYIDSVLPPADLHEQQIAEMPDYARQYGLRSFKFYKSGIPGIVKSVTRRRSLAGSSRSRRFGADVVACSALRDRERRSSGRATELVARKPEDARRLGGRASRRRRGAGDPHRAYLAKLAAVHLSWWHVSSRQGLDACAPPGAKAWSPHRRDQSRLFSAFSAMTRSDCWQDGAAGAHGGAPRRVVGGNSRRHHRHGRNRQHLAPARSKRPEAGLHGSRPGHPSLARIFPSCCITAAATASRSTASWDLATRAPLAPTAIFPRKGTIAPGSTPISSSSISKLEKSRARRRPARMSDFSPFEGKALRGWPVATIKAGKLVARDGVDRRRTSGRYLPRAAP